MTESRDSNNWYDNFYSKVNVSAKKNSRISKFYHLLLEKEHKSNLDMKILEVGGNQAEHLQYVANDYSSYILSDIRDIEVDIFDSRVNFLRADLENLPFENSTFDRVISTCVFHHVRNPEKGFEEIRRVLKHGGTFSLMLPNDPGLSYRVFRRLTSLKKARRFGIFYEARLAHAREHLNHYLSLKTLLEWVFRGDQIKYQHFPTNFPIYDLNLLTVCTIKIKKT